MKYLLLLVLLAGCATMAHGFTGTVYVDGLLRFQGTAEEFNALPGGQRRTIIEHHQAQVESLVLERTLLYKPPVPSRPIDWENLPPLAPAVEPDALFQQLQLPVRGNPVYGAGPGPKPKGVSPPIRVGEILCEICCPDMRWGKCAEHGEWLVFDKFFWGVDSHPNPSYDEKKCAEMKKQFPYYRFSRWRQHCSEVLLVDVWKKRLACPRGHYVEREIEGSKERP